MAALDLKLVFVKQTDMTGIGFAMAGLIEAAFPHGFVDLAHVQQDRRDDDWAVT